MDNVRLLILKELETNETSLSELTPQWQKHEASERRGLYPHLWQEEADALETSIEELKDKSSEFRFAIRVLRNGIETIKPELFRSLTVTLKLLENQRHRIETQTSPFKRTPEETGFLEEFRTARTALQIANSKGIRRIS